MCSVESLQTKLDEWRDRLEGDDIHSIRRQINNMLWRSAFYRSINESRRFLLDDGKGGKLANGSLHGLINDGYVLMQAAAIRRLVDNASSSGKKGVNSLHGLIRDIRDCCDLLTRENVLAARGLTYNYEPAMARAREDARVKAEKRGETAYAVSGEGWASARYWHETWDQLCGSTENTRLPTDHPHPEVFDRLLEGLKTEAGSVKNFVDKFIAHSATQESRNALRPGECSLSLDILWKAERVIVRAAGFVSIRLVSGASLGGVPIPQFDQFENLDRSFVERAALPAMEEAWETYDSEIRKCEKRDWTTPLADDRVTSCR